MRRTRWPQGRQARIAPWSFTAIRPLIFGSVHPRMPGRSHFFHGVASRSLEMTNLPRTGGANETRTRRATACFRAAAWGLMGAAFVAMALGVGGVLSNNDFLGLLPSACLASGYLLHRYAMRRAAADARNILARHPDGFVLLLRCFSMDDYGVIGESGFGPNFEETLVHTLRHIGPVIAVGRPDESLPPIGAARLYIDSGDWQAEVARLMESARAVVLVLFAREPPQATQEAQGFRWEIGQALSCVAGKKLLFALPAAAQLLSGGVRFGNGKKARSRQRSFEVFAESVRKAAPRLIARHADGAQFLRFDSSGQPVPLSARRLKYGHAGFADALQPFFQGLGLPPMTTNTIVLAWRFNEFFRLVVITVLCGWAGLWIFRT